MYTREQCRVFPSLKNGSQTSAIIANDTRWRPNSQMLHRRDRSNSRVTETARPSGVLSSLNDRTLATKQVRLYLSTCDPLNSMSCLKQSTTIFAGETAALFAVVVHSLVTSQRRISCTIGTITPTQVMVYHLWIPCETLVPTGSR